MSDVRFTEAGLGGLGLTQEELEAIADTDHPQENAPAPPTGTPFVFTPTYDGPSLHQIEERFADLDRQLEEGDIDVIEYTRQRDPLIQQATEARMMQKHHESQWRQEQDQFFSQHPEFRNDPALNGALQRAFRGLDTPENAHRTGHELLEEARRKVEESAARVLRERRSDIHDDRSGHGTRIDFDHLDRLTGTALEDALSRLPSDVVERYLREV